MGGFLLRTIPIFCYWCGKLDHDDRDYPFWIDSKESLVIEDRQFGPWLLANMERLQRPQVVEVPTRKIGGEGKSKECGQQYNNQTTRNNLWPLGVVHLSNDKEIPPPSKTATTVSDLVMVDVTPQENRPEDFEEKLREINCAINAVDILQGITGIHAPKREEKVGVGFSDFGQPEVLGARVNERATTTQLPSPSSKAYSGGPYGLASRQNKA